MATPTPGSYTGGAGGKFRKRTGYSRNTTPYDRPPTAIRNPIEGTRNGWISKIVDPTSRIITRTAQMFFPSVFRKNLPAPPSTTEASHESRENGAGVDAVIPSSGANDRDGNEADQSNNTDITKINDLEQILKQKTFTRAEIDRLTNLMHSRTVDVSSDHRNRTSAPSISGAATQENPDFAHMVAQKNGIDSQNLRQGISSPLVCSSDFEQELVSPAELAKAYMGKRPSGVSPSALGLRSQALRQDVPLLTNVPFMPKSPSMSLGTRSVVHVGGLSENGFMTPRPRGRSAIYSMARTPYSRGQNTGTPKVEAHATPSMSTQFPWRNKTLSGGKQASKRRMSVLDNDIGSVGPIRRIRQKTSMIASPSNNMIFSTPRSYLSDVSGNGYHTAQGSTSLAQRHLLDESKPVTSNLRESAKSHRSIPTVNFSSVPSQSSEMAQKISQQINKLVPSPKQKSSELKLAAVRENSPSKSPLDKKQGQASRSVNYVDSSKILVNAQNPDTSSSPMKNIPLGDKSTSRVTGVKTMQSNIPIEKTSNAISKSVVNTPLQQGFRVSAHEEHLKLDDDSNTGRFAPSPFSVEKQTIGASPLEIKTSVVETVTTVGVGKSSLSSSEAFPGSFITNGADTRTSDELAIPKKDTGFGFAVTSAPSTATLPTKLANESLLSVEQAIQKEQYATPVFSFASKSSEEVSQFETSRNVFGGAKSDSNRGTLLSAATLAAPADETAAEVVELVKSDAEKIEKAGHISRQPGNSDSSLVSASTPSSIFAFGASTKSSHSNGLFTSSSSMFSIPATPPVLNSSPGVVTSTATTTTTTTTIVPASTTTTTSVAIADPNDSQSTSSGTPSHSPSPIFQFGLSSSEAVVSSTNTTSLPLATSGVESDSETKTKQTSPFGSLNSFGASSPSFTSNGNGVFGFTSSAPSGTEISFANSQSQGTTFTCNLSQSSNPFAAATGSLFSAKVPAESGTGVAPITRTLPSQSGSSTPSFESSGSPASISGAFMFGSSAPGSKQSGSGSAFAQGSSVSFTTSSGSFSSSNGPTSLFSSASQSAPSSVFGSGFGASPSPVTTGYSFQSSTSPTGPAVSAFGASANTPAINSAASHSTGFSFGSTAAATSAPTTFGSSLGFSSAPTFSLATAAATTSSVSLSSSDQMTVEDSMAEDAVQASTPMGPTFGHPANSPSPFAFGSPAPGGPPMFQFSSQQNPSPFQSTGNPTFTAGGSFSLGTNTVAGDKSGRKIIRVKRDKLRKR